MATKTSPSRRTSRASKATRGGRRSAPKTPPKTPVRQILSPHARDAFGVFLVVLALVSVLGLWFHAAGPVGEFLTWALRGLFGVAAVAFPVLGIYWGLVLLRDTAREDRVRMFIGFSVLTVGVLGVVSLLRGQPGPRDGYDAVAVGGVVARSRLLHGGRRRRAAGGRAGDRRGSAGEASQDRPAA